MNIIKLKEGLEIRTQNNKYELWVRYNEEVYYKLFDISKETAEGLINDTTIL